MVVLHALEATTPPPPRYPDLYTVGNVLVSSASFLVSMFYFGVHQFRSP